MGWIVQHPDRGIDARAVQDRVRAGMEQRVGERQQGVDRIRRRSSHALPEPELARHQRRIRRETGVRGRTLQAPEPFERRDARQLLQCPLEGIERGLDAVSGIGTLSQRLTQKPAVANELAMEDRSGDFEPQPAVEEYPCLGDADAGIAVHRAGENAPTTWIARTADRQHHVSRGEHAEHRTVETRGTDDDDVVEQGDRDGPDTLLAPVEGDRASFGPQLGIPVIDVQRRHGPHPI